MRLFALKSAVALLALVTGTAALAQHEGHEMPMPQPEATPEPAPEPEREPGPDPHAAHDMHAMDEAEMTDMPGMAHMSGMAGALGSYAMTREASGTAWQPDSAQHAGIHLNSGDWGFMLHSQVDLVHDWQEGPRGDSKTFVAGMLMGTARRPVGDGTLQFRGMVSPDPLMGKKGYPLLLASGETANGRDPLIDRQHPHDFFMELSASLSQQIGETTSVFIYGGLPGEPAFGPPAFMHRQSIVASPEAPISHHWLDSTHITFGVVTAGLIHRNFKLEASRFNGREPDQHRWNIETGPLDSTAVRLSWNPTRTLSLQGSWAHLEEPEQLEPGVNQRRWSASAIYTRPMTNGWWSTTLAWGRKGVEGHDYDAFALESSLNWKNWTLFGRGEVTENNELTGDHHESFRAGKVSLGLVRDFAVADHLRLGVGGLYAFNFVPGSLESAYGGDPNGAMGFVRLKVE
jgi:hypothetical protein